MRATFLFSTVTIAMAVLVHQPVRACTNFLLTKGATTDGSTMITYAADSHELYGELYFTPAGRHAPGTMLDVYEWESGRLLGQIEQVQETYTVVGNMNELQVSIGETTWGGREELADPHGVMDYGALMYIALQRAKTAREAVEVMTDLVAEHGYPSSGETFSIADPDEVWIMDLIGKGPGNKGAVWVARKIPDGYISAHANSPRIDRFPLNEPETTLYAPDVISFAREAGFFEGPDEEFSFADAYSPPEYGARRFCDARVWCMYRRAAPSMDLPLELVKGADDAEPLPLWIKPDKKLSVSDVMALMRDHFEGTGLDMTKDIGAGPYDLPYRWRPLTWQVDDQTYLNERAVSTQQTAFSFIAQARSWLPDPVGGIFWFGVDDTYSTVYIPIYSSITEVPHNFAVGTGSFHDFTWESGFWVFNHVANFAYSRYSDMIKDIQVVQRELEGKHLDEVAEVDAAAMALYRQAPRLARDYLTEYSKKRSAETVERWRRLGEFLLYKYLDGNVKTELGEVTHPGYPESWYRKVAEATGEHLKMLQLPAEAEDENLAEEAEKEEVRALVEGILTLLDARGVATDGEVRTKIQECQDAERLARWLVRAATAESGQQILAVE